jgi:hypothetical protein
MFYSTLIQFRDELFFLLKKKFSFTSINMENTVKFFKHISLFSMSYQMIV